MTTLKTITLAAAFVARATSLGLAQNGPTYNGMPPSDYKGPRAECQAIRPCVADARRTSRENAVSDGTERRG